MRASICLAIVLTGLIASTSPLCGEEPPPSASATPWTPPEDEVSGQSPTAEGDAAGRPRAAPAATATKKKKPATASSKSTPRWFEEATTAERRVSPVLADDQLASRLVGRTLLVTAGFAISGMVVIGLVHLFGHKRKSARAQRASMALLDSLTLGPRCTLQLIRVDSQKFLVARDGSGVRSVTPMTGFAESLDALEEIVEEEEKATVTYSPPKRWDAGISLERPNKPATAPATKSQRTEPWPAKTVKR